MGGMSGGGMGFIFNPSSKQKAQERLQLLMLQTKNKFEHSIPFAMEPVVYDFRINENGTYADLSEGNDALLPEEYYTLLLPKLLKKDLQSISNCQRNELSILGHTYKSNEKFTGFASAIFDRMIPQDTEDSSFQKPLNLLLEELGFDSEHHERIKNDLKSGRIGLSKNRIPISTKIEDVDSSEISNYSILKDQTLIDIGLDSLRNR